MRLHREDTLTYEQSPPGEPVRPHKARKTTIRLVEVLREFSKTFDNLVYPKSWCNPVRAWRILNLLLTVPATPAAADFAVTLKFVKEKMPAIFAPESAHVGRPGLMRV